MHEWYSLSISGQTQNIPNGIPLTFMEMDTSCRTQALRKTYELLSWCVMLTLNTDVFKLFPLNFLVFIKNNIIIQNTVFAIPLQNRTASHTLDATENTQFFISIYRLIYLVLFRYTLKTDRSCQALFLKLQKIL